MKETLTKTEELIGRTFGYKGIGNMVYVIVIQSFEPKGEIVDADSYTGKQTLIFPNGESLTQDWCCVKSHVDRKVESGEYKLLK
jgi:hypothetical protein